MIKIVLDKIPYLLIKIKEFEDILYLNDTNIGGFCQIIWEKKAQ